MAGPGFTHLDESGNVRMVDITGKDPTLRRAVAACRVIFADAPARHPDPVVVPDALVESARVAGILAAKQTSSLVPLCHPIPVGDVIVEISVRGPAIEVTVAAITVARTGIEMEALTACAVAALTLVKGCECPERATIDGLCVLEKTGGRSGPWTRKPTVRARSSTVDQPPGSDS